MTNIVRHADATIATIQLVRENGQIWLRIEDDGRGFDVAQTPRQAVRLQHFGLLGMRERAELVGGTVTLSSQPGHGTCLEVSLPLDETGANHGQNPPGVG